ncbi:MAG TPA: hypothetical protein VFW50_32700 [Streptosporangiaceae bacterium]|nr:hypothetical protein [Streptosporangiaceae bacterium]
MARQNADNANPGDSEGKLRLVADELLRTIPTLGHLDAAIYLSQPGVADVLGARQLGEFGDEPHRYASARAR